MSARFSIAVGLLAGVCACGGSARAQTSRPTSQPASQSHVPQAIADLVETLTANGVTIDVDAKTVTIDAEVGRPSDLLEYVLIHPRGKTHESLLISEVVPSMLNTGMLAIGLEAGENARVEEKVPAPTLEEVQAGAEWLDIFPPKGKSIYITLTWTHEGVEHLDVPIEDLLLDLETDRAVVDNRWVFLGGNMAPLLRGEEPVFVGDYQGNIVSSCYMQPSNHLVTIVHERATSEQNWWLTNACPPTGTKLRVTFHAEKPPTVAAREQRIAAERAQATASKPTADEADAKQK